MSKYQFEKVEAHVSDKVNTITGHEPFNWGTKIELARRELGAYIVKEFFVRVDRKTDGKIFASYIMDTDKMRDYLKWYEEESSKCQPGIKFEEEKEDEI